MLEERGEDRSDLIWSARDWDLSIHLVETLPRDYSSFPPLTTPHLYKDLEKLRTAGEDLMTKPKEKWSKTTNCCSCCPQVVREKEKKNKKQNIELCSLSATATRCSRKSFNETRLWYQSKLPGKHRSGESFLCGRGIFSKSVNDAIPF